MNQTLSLTTLGGLAEGDRSTSSSPCGPTTASAATSSRATSTAPAELVSVDRRRLRPAPALRAARRPAALRRRARLDRDRGRQPHGRRRRSGRRRLVRGLADPRDARAHHARAPGARRRRQRRVRRAGALRASACCPPCHHPRREQPDDQGTRDPRHRQADKSQPTRPFSTDRGGDRGPPPRPDGRRLRRRGPRERGRPRPGRPVRDPRGGQLHGQGRARPDLPRADPRALRRARPRPDGRQERVAARDRLHGHDRGRRGRHHRDLGPRPRPHDPGRDRSPREARRPAPARPRLPAEGQGGRRARAHRPHRGEHRPRAARRPDPGRGDLRDHERGRDDGPRPRPGPLLRAPRPEDDHGRRPDLLPPAHRAPGRAHRLDQAADQVRRVQRRRLPLAGRRQAPRRDGQGRGLRRRGRAGPRPLRVPDRRRLPLAALRLRRAARGGAGDDRAEGQRASCSTSPRRAAASACSTSSAPTSSRRTGSTPSTPTSSSACRPTCATTASAPRSSATSA